MLLFITLDLNQRSDNKEHKEVYRARQFRLMIFLFQFFSIRSKTMDFHL